MWWVLGLTGVAVSAPVFGPWADPSTVIIEYDGRDGDLILEDILGAGLHPSDVVVRQADGSVVPLPDLMPDAPVPVPIKEPTLGERSLPVTHPGRGDGALSGHAVYMSQCHGWMYFHEAGFFSTQRGNLFTTVEDYHNPEGANAFLIPYLENAGALVFTARERDMQEESVISDNDGEGYTESGAGFEAGYAGFKNDGPWDYGEDPFDAGTTRRFPADGGGVATWTPDVPVDGHYAVYLSWDSAPEHAQDAHYRITHPGGTIDRYVDQTVHGSTWFYVDSLYLPQGKSLTVELIGDSDSTGRFLSADAVRVGGGLDDVRRVGQTTGLGRWESAAIHNLQFNGAPTSVYDPFGSGNGSDPSVRSRWAAWEHPSGEDAVYVSWHSNATSTGTARGTTTYYAGGGPDAPSSHAAECSSAAPEGSFSLARLLQDEIVDAARANWEPDWRGDYGDDGINRACFSEVNPNNNPEMPAALVELAFHDNEDDAWFLTHPEFRRDMSRAMYRAVVRYFAERDGETALFLPEPPERLALRHDAGGALELSWSPGPVGAPYGDAAESYLVQTSMDGLVWTDAFETDVTTTRVPAAPGVDRFVRVVARNAGGVSFPSEVIGARRDPNGEPSVLVVTGFHRFNRGLLPSHTPRNLGRVYRMDLPRMNPFDAVVAHGLALSDAGWTYDAIHDDRFLEVAPNTYDVVIWAAGEESSEDITVTPEQQAWLRDVQDAGGVLIFSGAELLWDLAHLGTASDQAFAEDVLGATMLGDDSGTNRATGAGLLDGLNLDFGEASGAPYPVEFADELNTTRDVIATYGTGTVPAAAMGEGVALFGFPFETIGSPQVRTQVMDRLIAELAPDVEPPDFTDVQVDTGVPLDDGVLPGRGGGLLVGQAEGCGCATTGTGLPTWMVLPLMGVLGWRRRG